MKYSDVHKVGSSKIVPYVPGEHPSDRHLRRLETNLAEQETVKAWANSLGLELRILNNGHHWIFKVPGFCVEWWPSSAKLVFQRRYQRGIHAHDWAQVQKQIELKLKR